MRIVAFITLSANIHKTHKHIGVDAEAPRIAPAHRSSLREDRAAQETGEGVEGEPDWDLANRSLPDYLDYPDDQRTAW